MMTYCLVHKKNTDNFNARMKKNNTWQNDVINTM